MGLGWVRVSGSRLGEGVRVRGLGSVNIWSLSRSIQTKILSHYRLCGDVESNTLIHWHGLNPFLSCFTDLLFLLLCSIYSRSRVLQDSFSQ